MQKGGGLRHRDADVGQILHLHAQPFPFAVEHVPAAVARTLGAVDTARGREDAFRMQRPQVLEALIDVARIQSTEASNAIEQVVAPRKRIEALVAQKTAPQNRSEAEIAGDRAVLDLIHERFGAG